jgi:hypothetical protein
LRTRDAFIDVPTTSGRRPGISYVIERRVTRSS